MKNRKLYLVPLIAVLFAFLTVFLGHYTQSLLRAHIQFLNHLSGVESNLHKISENIYKSSFFIYYNYDELDKNINKVYKIFEHVDEDHKSIINLYPESYKKLLEFEKLFKKEEEKIYRFQSLNSILKNSQIYIPSLAIRYLKIAKNPDKKYLTLLVETVANVLILKNSFDIQSADIKSNIEELRNYEKYLKTDEEKQFNKIILKHLITLDKYYPEYIDLFSSLTVKNNLVPFLNEIKNIFEKESQTKLSIVKTISWILNVVFFIVISYLAVLLIKIDKQKKELDLLHKNLEKALVTDELTGLPNRKAFYLDKSSYKNPTVILINLDKFKNINDLYGHHIGDKLLKKVAKDLKEFIQKCSQNEQCKVKLYRVGADDFLILMEDHLNEALTLAQEIASFIENKTFNVEGIDISISVSCGISAERPLLEKADMALKFAKVSRERIVVYDKNLNLEKEFEENIKTIHIVKDALKNDRLVVFYQPLVDNKTGKIDKYEALFRIIDKDGNIIPPLQVLTTIQKTKYYRDITEEVARKVIKTLKKHENIQISINLSYEDIVDKEVKSFLMENICKVSDIAHRVSFEILESESIKNYENVDNFIKAVRKHGSKISIDDFGSGYSNFVYLSKMKPDYIKIDGSLIKDIHKNEELKIIVATINNFAHKLGIKTVAEYVHCKEVFEIVNELGIDYSQGYYIGKPSPHIVI